MPVTDLFKDHHHEQISCSRSRNRFSAAFFGLMEERGELPKQLSMREKAGCQHNGHPLKRRSWAILDASNIPRVSQNCVF
jgi:hypothetical protein